MDWFEWLVTQVYLPRKAKISFDAAPPGSPMRQLPVLGRAGGDGRLSVETLSAINKHLGQHRYRMDQLWGLGDIYNHPQYSQYLLETGNTTQPMDCDDFAVKAVALAWACGMQRDKAWVWNLVVRPWNLLDQGWANHVIAGFEFFDGKSIWTAVIDTNSAAQGRVNWYQGTRDEVKPAVMRHFAQIYRVNYQYLLQVPFPFKI